MATMLYLVPCRLCLTTTKKWVAQAMIHAKIEVTLQDKVRRYTKIWQPWVNNYLPPGFWCRLFGALMKSINLPSVWALGTTTDTDPPPPFPLTSFLLYFWIFCLITGCLLHTFSTLPSRCYPLGHGWGGPFKCHCLFLLSLTYKSLKWCA